jgi:hypothetical protein
MSQTATPSSIHDLAFLTGRWHGDGFVMEFGEAYGTMLFGFMQATQDGKTVYWETFRFAEEDGVLAFYPAHMGQPVGRYPLASAGAEAVRRVVFANAELRLRTLSFACSEEGDRLTVSVEGTRDDQPYRQSWELVRVSGG